MQGNSAIHAGITHQVWMRDWDCACVCICAHRCEASQRFELVDDEGDVRQDVLEGGGGLVDDAELNLTPERKTGRGAHIQDVLP
jgi:hypothetical protein